MNRQLVVKILSKLLENHMNGFEFTTEEFDKFIKSLPYESQDSNEITLYEQKLVMFLFSKLQYYQIIPFLKQFQMRVKTYNKSTIKGIVILINSYIEELIFTLNERIKQEIYLHIYRLLINFYQSNSITLKANLIQKNLYSPYEISSIGIAEQIKYEQVSLFATEQNKIDLKDEVSKTNFFNKDYIQTRVKKLIKSNFNSSDIINFYKALSYYINNSSEIDEQTKMILHDIYFKELECCISSIKKISKKSDGYSYVFTIN